MLLTCYRCLPRQSLAAVMSLAQLHAFLQGLDVGVAQMNQGEHATLRVTPDYAVGSQGVGEVQLL